MTDSPHTYACIFLFLVQISIFSFSFFFFFFSRNTRAFIQAWFRNRISLAYRDIIAQPAGYGWRGRRWRLICVTESVLYGRIRPWTTEYCSIQTIHESRGFEWAMVHRDFDRHRVSFDHQSCCSLIAARFQNCSHAARFALCHVGQQLFNPHRGCNGKRYKLPVVVVMVKGTYKMHGFA